MNTRHLIDTAVAAHRQLRSEPPAPRVSEERRQTCDLVVAALEQLWTAAGSLSRPREARSGIERLRADAEFYAGLSDAEGYRNENEVWEQYAALRDALTPEHSGR